MNENLPSIFVSTTKVEAPDSGSTVAALRYFIIFALVFCLFLISSSSLLSARR